MRRAQLEHKTSTTAAEAERDARDAEALRDRVRALSEEEARKREERAAELQGHKEFLLKQVCVCVRACVFACAERLH